MTGSVPISGLPAGTTPLDGTEEIPMVQGGVTVKVPSSAVGFNGTYTGHIAFGDNATVDTINTPNTNAGTDLPAGVALQNEFIGDASAVSWLTGYGDYTTYKHTGSGAATYYGVGMFSQITADSTGPWNQWYGADFESFNYGSGDIDWLLGARGISQHQGSGDITTYLAGLYGWASSTVGSGTVAAAAAVLAYWGIDKGTDSIGFWAQPAQNGGSCVNNYGLKIDDQSSSGATNNWNILSLGAGKNEFGGVFIIDLAHLPTSDPNVAGQLFTVGAPTAGVPKALFISGG